MIIQIINNLLGYFLSVLLVLQYFGSNGLILDSGFNHTLLLQCIICLFSVPFFYFHDKVKTIKLVGFHLIFLLFSIIHYELVANVNDYVFSIAHLWSYVKFFFYLHVFIAIYYFFEGKDYFAVLKVAKFIVITLFIESLFYIFFKLLGFSNLASLFVSVEGRFAGIFMMNNSLVGLFALFVMSYVIFFGNLRERWSYLTIGVFLIVFAGERSIVLGLIFLMFSYVLFSYDQNRNITNYKIKIFISFSALIIGFVILYTIFIRGYNIQSIGEFFRPLILRLYYSYLTIAHIFESNSSVIGFGPFIDHLPTNYSDLYSDYIKSFRTFVKSFFGDSEEIFFKNFHDSGNIESPSYIINAHNTFVLLFFKFGYFFVGLLLFFIYLFFFNIKFLREGHNKILGKRESYFQLSSVVFLTTCFTPLFFLSLDNYLLLVTISLGQIGSFFRNVKYVQ